MSEEAKNPLKLFYCYAHQDKDLRNALDSHLSALKQQKLIEIWYDGEIGAGIEWEREIDKRLNTADIILLLVSADFLASNYCYGKEMKRALQRHEEGTARVVPIIIRPVYWKKAPFSKLQVLPTGAKPVTSWLNTDEAYEDITRKLDEIIEELQALRTTKEKWLAKGDALYALVRYKEALEAYEHAIRLDPRYANAYVSKGDALNELMQHEEALKAYERAIRLDPNNALAYYNKGNALYDLKRYEEALKAYEQAIQLDPNNVLAYYNKGNALSYLKQYEEALKAYEQAIWLDPNDANAYVGIGQALNELKRYEEAAEACEQAIRLDSDDAYAYYNNGIALSNLGRSREAKQSWKKARELGWVE